MQELAGSHGSQSYLFLGVAYAFAAAVQPGPMQAYLIINTLAHGWRRTFPAVFAPILSDIPTVCLVLLVLTRIPALFVPILQCAGGIFLFYLSFGAFKAFREYRFDTQAEGVAVHQTVLNATIVNLLNPNPYLGWALVMGPLLLKAWNRRPLYGIAFVASFYGTLVLSSTAIIILFSRARSMGPRITRILVCISAVALLIFGLYQVWSGASTIIGRSMPLPGVAACTRPGQPALNSSLAPRKVID